MVASNTVQLLWLTIVFSLGKKHKNTHGYSIHFCQYVQSHNYRLNNKVFSHTDPETKLKCKLINTVILKKFEVIQKFSVRMFQFAMFVKCIPPNSNEQLQI